MGLPWNVNASMGGSGINDQILRSLRFRASATAYMARTPSSASNQTTWTWSAWVKKGNNSSYGCMFGAYTGAGATYTVLQWQNDNTLVFYNQTSSSITMNLNTTQVFRDPSAWYHVVAVYDSTQATASNRGKIYINGVQVTAFSTATYPSLNANATVNSAVPHDLGRFGGAANYFDGYLAEVNFIDGQALTPSSFGYYDPQTGVWQPAPFKGTYGTNGFYLPFTDIATTSGSNFGLGRDYSGNANYWNTNNISVTSGATYDSMIDSPTNFGDGTGIYNRGSYAVMNPLNSAIPLQFGNLRVISSATNTIGGGATFAFPSGQWYWEATVTLFSGASTNILLGITDAAKSSMITPSVSTPSSAVDFTYGYAYTASSGNIRKYAVDSAYGATFTTGDIIGIAYDATNNTITFYKNGTSQGQVTGLTAGTYIPWVYYGGSSATNTVDMNFGQRPFSYTPPTGFKALNTFNLPTPTIPNGAAYMATTTYTGNGTSQSIVNSGSFQPDFVWMKSRSNAYNNILQDSVRGAGKNLQSNTTNAETGNSGDLVSSFNSNGFTVNNTYLGGTDPSTNGSAATYIGWQWKAGAGTTSTNTSGSITSTVSVSAQSGFSVVTYTGNGTAGSTVGHSLGVAPNLIIWKKRSSAANWFVWSKAADVAAGSTRWGYLNATNAFSTSASTNEYPTYKVDPTSAVFTVNGTGSSNGTNDSSATYVAYCFAAVSGYSAFGSYTGNGSSDGPFVYTGFRPRYVLIKDTAGIADWNINDSSRDTYNQMAATLFADASSAESSQTAIDFLSNGFKIRGSTGQKNSSGTTYIYAAFAENPFNYSRAR